MEIKNQEEAVKAALSQQEKNDTYARNIQLFSKVPTRISVALGIVAWLMVIEFYIALMGWRSDNLFAMLGLIVVERAATFVLRSVVSVFSRFLTLQRLQWFSVGKFKNSKDLIDWLSTAESGEVVALLGRKI